MVCLPKQRQSYCRMSLNYLADGDVLRLWTKNNEIRVLYRRNSFHNHFLLTETVQSLLLDVLSAAKRY